MKFSFWSSKSWNVSVGDKGSNKGKKQGRSSWEKLTLLLWKNYTVQMRHKWQTLIELLLPLLFVIILVIIRTIVKSNIVEDPTFYQPFKIVPPYEALFLCEEIYYSPKNNITDAVMQNIKKTYFEEEGIINYNFTGFESEEEMVNAFLYAATAVKPEDDLVDITLATVPILAGVVFDNNFTDNELPQHIKYKLRFPSSLRGQYDIIEEKSGLKAFWYTEIAYPLVQLLGPRARNKTTGGLPGYFEEGFLYLQNALDQTFMKMIYNSSAEDLEKLSKIDVKLQRFPYIPYAFDLYLFALQGFLPLLMLLSFIYPVINISKSIVLEKEKRLKESMKMMGLSNWLHWVAWMIKSFLFLMISCFLITILLKVRFSEAQFAPIVPKTDGTLIYFVLLMFSFSTICFCFFISAMFSRANPAATGAAAVWILFYVPFAFLQPRYNLLPFWVKLVSCIFTNTPISFACQIICLFEGAGEGLQWSSIFEGTSPDDNFSMVYALIMMVVNSFIYLIITFYVEAVFPGEYGIPLPWNFFMKKWYWTDGSREDFEFDFSKTPAVSKNFRVEQSSQNLKPGIEIKNLTKQFGRKTAVNKLNLDIYEGQITALLGHNGAGKTTTISILTGLFPPTSGTAVINGYDIHRDMKSIRSSLGICPQHDVLFDELTVAEHLEFFCLLKGMEKKLVENEINRLLVTLGLESKRDAKSRTLSGGQKRKLSVLIAFCAGSKIVLLDECTSGMDSGSRRMTWDLIQSEKKGRTIILSTHFMEEADVLGDRISIMAEGALQCCGSSLFLKKSFGGGYHLIIVKTPTCIVDNITNLLKNSIPETEMDQNVGAELSYILPDSKSHLFPAIFENIEANRVELGIASYGASITTMEEVFMRVLKDSEASRSSTNRTDLDLVQTTSHTEINNLDTLQSDMSILFNNEVLKRNSGFHRLCQQFWAMLVKKMLYAYRNLFLICFQMILPMVYMTITFLALKAFPGFYEPTSFNLSTLERYEPVGRTTTLVNCDPNASELCNSYIDYVSQKYYVENLMDTNETVATQILKVATKKLTVANYRHIVAYEEHIGANNVIEAIGYFNNQPFHAPPLALNFITNALLRKSNYTIETYNHPFPYSTLDSVKEAGGVLTLGFQVGYNTTIVISFLTATFVVFLVRERMSGCKHLQFVSGVRFILFWAANFVVDFMNFIIPCVGILLLLNIFGIEEFTQTKLQIYYLLLMSLFGFAIIPFTYLMSYLGTNPTTGYSRMVVFNAFIGLSPMLTMVFISLPGFNLEYLGDSMNKWFMISPNYAMGQALVQLSTNFHLGRFCGSVQFFESVCDATSENFCCKYVKNNYLDWERMGIGRNLVYLAVSGCLYFIILFAVEFKIFKRIANCFRKTNKVLDDSASMTESEEDFALEDSDVVAENEKIRKTNLNTLFQSENLVVRDLTKIYDDFVAVDHINFAVQPGECFGLLGVNGAGKTTTFKQLTGDIPVTYGDAFVIGNSVRSKLRNVHENIGYTPQFDGLIDEMTGRETIRMFARLKGVPENTIDGLIEELGRILMFSQHLDKWACNLSGGNKRKLSTACSLVGKPPVVLLDEPSSGMDPVARRSLWNAISMIRDAGTSIVLTTHSLEEAEALCTRMGIMVNGRFRCLGSPQHLKNKYSKGYTLIAQTKVKMSDEAIEEPERRKSSVKRTRSLKRTPSFWETSLDDLRNFIENAFPGCVLKDIHPGFVHYHIMPNEETSWGRMFSIMEQARTTFALEAYSVGQTSLEQVFLNFTKGQINNE